MRKSITRTNTNARIGMNKDTKVITIDVPVSMVETNGLAIPPVVAVDAKRVAPELPAMAAAVPPPAIMAKAQVIAGLKSATVETITAVPAIVANGMAMESRILSIYGIKYPKISTSVATPNVMTAVRLPIHSHDSLSSQRLKCAARLKANRGTNTRKPTEAANPTPKNMLKIVSVVIIIKLTVNGLQKIHL